jgi:hypothetical protein
MEVGMEANTKIHQCGCHSECPLQQNANSDVSFDWFQDREGCVHRHAMLFGRLEPNRMLIEDVTILYGGFFAVHGRWQGPADILICKGVLVQREMETSIGGLGSLRC